MAQVSLKFIDRLGNQFRFSVRPGQRLVDVLAENGIPTQAVITRRNGVPVSEYAVDYAMIGRVTVEMVRAYHLRQLSRETETSKIGPQTVYLKAMLQFTSDGGGINTFACMDAEQFRCFVQQTFLQSLERQPLIEPGDHLMIGFSGGRDSLAMMVLLNELKHRLPPFHTTAVTINDCIDGRDLRYTREICNRFGLEHLVVERPRIVEKFHLAHGLAEALQRIYRHIDRGRTIYVLHHIMRVMIEEVAASRQTGKIALGLHKEDIAASMVRSVTTGRPVGNPWGRSFGGFEYVYPLYALSKKELTLFLMLYEPPYANQGAAATFDRGTVERDINYAAVDHLGDLWPGFCENLFTGYEALRRKLAIVETFHTCANCRGSFLGDEQQRVCPVCVDLAQVGALTKKWAEVVEALKSPPG